MYVVRALFDLKNDVGETTNLAASNPEKLAELREAFEQWKSKVVNRTPVYTIPSPDQYERN